MRFGKFDRLAAALWLAAALLLLPGAQGSVGAADALPAIEAADGEIAWFPETSTDLSIRPPVRPMQAPPALDALPREHAMIPLPPAAWTGLAGLAMLAVPRCRRTLQRMMR